MSRNESYGGQLLEIEPFGADAIPAEVRHGKVSSCLTLWSSANLNILTWFTGSLMASIGLSFAMAWRAIVIGNAAGASFVGLAAAMGPSTGEPQLISTRRSFTLRWARLPAGLNWLTLMGWFGVDAAVGVFALDRLDQLPYAFNLIILSGVTVVVAVFGHNVVHWLARLSTLVIGLIFAAMTILALKHGAISGPSHSAGLGAFILGASFSFAYLFSFASVGSDYTRYLPKESSKRSISLYSALGAFAVATWLETLGAATASVGNAADPMARLGSLMGAFAAPALLAVAISTIPVNAISLYSGALSSLAAGLPLRRWVAVLLTGAVGTVAMLWGGGSFANIYKNFILLLSYWIAPWLGIVLVDFYVHGHHQVARRSWPAVLAFALGLAVSVPFMDSVLYQGYLATRYLGGADISYLIGMATSALAYYLWGSNGAVRGRAQRAKSQS